MKIFAILAALTISTISMNTVFAQSDVDLSFAVRPAIIELAGEPGDTIEGSVTFQNTNDDPVPTFLEVDSLVPIDNIVDQARRSSFDASAWIELNTSTVLFDGNEQKDVSYTVTIPDDANPGGHYAVISLTPGVTDAPRDETRITPQLSAQLFITVAGEINEQAEIVAEDLEIGNVIRGSTQEISFRLRNTGNVHVLPAPRVSIIKDDVAVEIFSLQPQLILPNTEKTFTVQWKADVDFGNYTIQAETIYGSESIPFATTPHEFLVVPNFLQIFLYVLLGLLALVLIIKRKNIPRTIAVLRGHANFRGKSYKQYAGQDELPDAVVEVRTLDEIAEAVKEQERAKPILGLPDRLQHTETREITDLTKKTPTPPKPANKPEVLSKTRVNDTDKTTFITQTSASTIVREASPFFDPDVAEEQPAKKIAVQHEDDAAAPIKKTASKTTRKPVKKSAPKKTTSKKTPTKPAAKKKVAPKTTKKKPTAKKTTPAKKKVAASKKKTASTKKATVKKRAPAKKTAKPTANKASSSKKPGTKKSTGVSKKAK